MRVKSFYAVNTQNLDSKVNNFLASNNIEVIDIKFSSSLFYFSSMIIFKEN